MSTTDVFAVDAGDLMFESSTEGQTEDSLYSGAMVSKEGYYHVNCVAIEKVDKTSEGKTPHLKIDLQIVAGDHEDQRDKLIYHRLFLARAQRDVDGTVTGFNPFDPADEKDKKALDGINTFAFAFGVIGTADLGKNKVAIPFGMINGAQAVVRVQKDDDWTDKEGNKKAGGLKILWNNDAWPVGHERVKDVPKDPEALLAMGGIGGSSGGGNGQAAADDFSDL
jgi:hypothetical protein